METSAGLLIIQNNKILLVHPTGAKENGTYSIPKGHVEEDETYLQTAIRETFEEVGLLINENDIDSELYLIKYRRKKKTYKKVYYYIAKPKDIIDVKSLKLQPDEVNHVDFFDCFEAEEKIMERQKEILKHLK